MLDLDVRMKRLADAVALKEPDKVPIAPVMQCYPILRAGRSMKDALYDYEAGADCIFDYVKKFEPDHVFGHNYMHIGKGPMFEKLLPKTTIWAGDPDRKIPDDSIHQFVEFPVLEGADIPFFNRDGTGWLIDKGLPGIFGVFEPLGRMGFSSWALSSEPGEIAAAFSDPGVRKMIETLWAVNDMNNELNDKTMAFEARLEDAGFPVMNRGFAIVPFDEYSDFYRGTTEAMIDMLEREDEVLAFCEARLGYRLESIRLQGQFLKGRWVFIPLHKGMDRFMSDEQYKKLYWPHLRAIIEEIVNCGMTPYVYTEGPYDTRIETLAEVPKGKVIYHFETVDMARAKKILGGTACITGGFPVWLLEFGTKEKVVEECKRLLDACADGGGFIFETGCGFDRVKEENVEAMFQTVNELGKY